MDPQNLQNLIDYLLHDIGNNAANTNSRMFDMTHSRDIFDRGVPINDVSEVMGETSPRNFMGLKDLMQLPHQPGDIGIGRVVNRLSGEGNLGTLLMSSVIPIMASRGDPMAGYIMELMRGGNGSMMPSGPQQQV